MSATLKLAPARRVIGTSWAGAAAAISNRLMIVRMIERASHINKSLGQAEYMADPLFNPQPSRGAGLRPAMPAFLRAFFGAASHVGRPETGKRYELYDGEAVLALPARPLHIKLQKRIERLLEALAGESGVVTTEFRFADVAFLLQADWDALPPDDYPVYAPALIVEVLSPSNTSAKIGRQRIRRAVGGDARVLGGGSRSPDSTGDNLSGTNVYALGDDTPLPMFGAGLALTGSSHDPSSRSQSLSFIYFSLEISFKPARGRSQANRIKSNTGNHHCFL
jgi:hypothetical protein